MFTVTARGSNRVVATLQSVEDALIADASHLQVEAHGRGDVLALAAARIESSPDYNQAPGDDETWVTYKTKAGRKMFCQVVRLLNPDSEGYPQHVELISQSRPDNSFVGAAASCTAVDLSAMSPELAKALTEGGDELESNDSAPKIKHGLRK